MAQLSTRPQVGLRDRLRLNKTLTRNDKTLKVESAYENLRRMQSTLHVAEEVGASLERGQVL
jgi:hypothetical protein